MSDLTSRLTSLRLGAATNSSSSHSVIFYDGPSRLTDNLDEDDYGWGMFVAASAEQKKHYIMSQWCTGTHDYTRDDEFLGVDHQSVWTWPKDKHGAFSKDVLELVLCELGDDPRVVILGGNDNGGEHPYDGAKVPLYEFLSGAYGTSRYRKDPGGWITLFTPKTYSQPGGLKMRFGERGEKSYTPELVDIKITDYCTYGCDFCYQGSTAKGKAATKTALNHCVKILREMDVLEVAIGGGEPTTHPQFAWFVKRLHDAGIAANVTTKNKAFLKTRQEYVNATGFSIQSAKEVKRYSSLCYHVVLGSIPMSEVYRILMVAEHVLLLDWKTTGRGARGPDYDYSNWLEVVRAVKALRIDAADFPRDSNWSVGIDTPLAKRFHTELQDIGIPEVLYETEEGKHSAYWDLVEGKFGASSYGDTLTDVPKLATASWFRREFAQL